MNNYRLDVCNKIEQMYFQGDCTCTILGKGRTANAIVNYLKQNSRVESFRYMVEDGYTKRIEERLSYYLEQNKSNNAFVVFGFSDYDRAEMLAKEVFEPNGIKSFFYLFQLAIMKQGSILMRDSFKIIKTLLAQRGRC